MKHLIILFSSLLIAGVHTQCRKPATTAVTTGTVPPVVSPPTSTAKTFLALGDSYTIGQSITASERFPTQTVAMLRGFGINIADPKYIATTGWTTQNLSQGIYDQHLTEYYDVVTLLIGVNDQYQTHDTTGYRQRFHDLLLKAVGFAKNDRNRVFVVSIPDYSVTPFAMYSDTAFIHKQIDQFNAINKDVTGTEYCHYLDITPSTREALYDPSLIVNDGLHPSGKEYTKWATRLSAMMKPVLQ